MVLIEQSLMLVITQNNIKLISKEVVPGVFLQSSMLRPMDSVKIKYCLQEVGFLERKLVHSSSSHSRSRLSGGELYHQEVS